MATILIIDDDPIFIETAVFLLEQLEHKILATIDGVRGYEMAIEHQPHVILCDVRMRGGMHGYATAQALKENRETEHIPIVMITGYGSPYGELRSRRSGADYYLYKPLSIHELVQMVEKALVGGSKTKRSSDLIFPGHYLPGVKGFEGG